jgi:hypothetical protein
MFNECCSLFGCNPLLCVSQSGGPFLSWDGTAAAAAREPAGCGGAACSGCQLRPLSGWSALAHHARYMKK